jgi:GntR family transcriptional regulator / MocR family aminotransferase
MHKGATSGPLLSLMLDPKSSTPLYRQLYEQLRQEILTGSLPPGTRLPATRTFARSHGISRNTVLVAFEQLLYEGYLRGKVGSGTYVEDILPDELLHPPVLQSPVLKGLAPFPDSTPSDLTHAPSYNLNHTHAGLSQRGIRIATNPVAPVRNWEQLEISQAFRPGVPALDEFPFKIWSRLAARRWRNAESRLFGYTNPAGYQPLRKEIAAYVQAARGVRCSAEQIIIVAGSQQAIILAANLLTDTGDAVWIEDPCYMGARGALLSSGMQLVPVPVDQEGLVVSEGIVRSPQARMVYVTPSHQFPTGVTMSLARRLALLQWARRTGSWILEDDYDGEYRYMGRPLASLQGLDTAGRVIYIGTFSKVLFPSLRLGYLVAPRQLVDAFTEARGTFDRNAPIHEQMVMTDFIVEEHFARHIRRMRTLYEERQHILLAAIQEYLPEQLLVQQNEAGMHLVARLTDPQGYNTPDTEIVRLAADNGVAVNALSRYYIEHEPHNALLMGFAAYNERMIHDGIKKLAHVLRRGVQTPLQDQSGQHPPATRK